MQRATARRPSVVAVLLLLLLAAAHSAAAAEPGKEQIGMVAQPRSSAKMALDQLQPLELSTSVGIDAAGGGGGLRRRLLARRLLAGFQLPLEQLADAAAANLARPLPGAVPCPSQRQQMETRQGNPNLYMAQYYVSQQPLRGFPSAAIAGRK